MIISILIAEATACDFKEALEVRKPKSWILIKGLHVKRPEKIPGLF